MAILETEVWVGLGGGENVKYFESIGYEIPRSINKYGKLTVPKGSKILVKVGDLKGGKIKVTKICDECGKQTPNQDYGQILKQRENGKDRCHSCGLKITAFKKKNNVKYEKTLGHYALNNSKGYLLTEFSNKNNKQPYEIAYSTKDELLWNCPNCKSEYLMEVDKRTCGGHNCPYCRGYRVNHTNCIANTHPEFSKLLKNKQRGLEITAGCNEKEYFVCDKCNHEQIKNVNVTVRQGFRCSKCSDGISYPEKIMFNILDQLSIPFETQYKFDWADGKKYDFYIPHLSMIIETHGEQHYIESFGKFGLKSLEEEQENDRVKERLATDNNVKEYVIIDCRKSDLDFIRNNIISSKLSSIYDITTIDWFKCHEYACNTLVKTVCDMWNEGIKNTLEIGGILKLGRYTVTKYLKQGVVLGWCDYDPKEEMKNNSIKNGHKRRKKIIQLTINGEFIREWSGAIEVENQLGILNISNVCKGKYKSAGGFRWTYKEDYDLLSKTN